MHLPITSLFAALLTLLLFGLTMIVIVSRTKSKIDLGDGGNPLLTRRIRAHGNFVEYVPIGLILLCLNELSGTASNWLWTIGVLLLIGRILHAMGLLFAILPARVVGTILTNWSLLLGAVLLLMHALN